MKLTSKASETLILAIAIAAAMLLVWLISWVIPPGPTLAIIGAIVGGLAGLVANRVDELRQRQRDKEAK